MITAITEWIDRQLGRGSASITVPVFDGALKSNRYIEDARVLATLEAPEDLATDGVAVFVTDGAKVLQVLPEGLQEVLQAQGTITALAWRWIWPAVVSTATRSCDAPIRNTA